MVRRRKNSIVNWTATPENESNGDLRSFLHGAGEISSWTVRRVFRAQKRLRGLSSDIWGSYWFSSVIWRIYHWSRERALPISIPRSRAFDKILESRLRGTWSLHRRMHLSPPHIEIINIIRLKFTEKREILHWTTVGSRTTEYLSTAGQMSHAQFRRNYLVKISKP
jgi:hypothetical protein